MSRIKCANCGSEADSRGATLYCATCFERRMLAVTCPNCGDPAVPIPLADLDGLHCGLTVMCPMCGEDIIFGTFTTDEYEKIINQAKETHGLHPLDCNRHAAAAQ